MPIHRIAALTLLYMVGIHCSNICDAGETVPARIEQDLKANASSLHQLTVEYTVVCSSPLPRATVLERIKQTHWLDFAKPDFYRLVLQDDKWLHYRKLWVYEPNGKLLESEGIETFDGQLEYGSNLRKRGAIIGILDARYLQKHSSLSDIFGYNYFLSDAGFSVPKESVSSWLPLEATVLHMLRNGATLIRQSGEPSASEGDYEVVLATPEGEHRYVLDLAKRCAVRVHEERSKNGDLRYATSNTKFERLGKTGAWLPTFCRMECYTWDTAPQLISPTPLVFEDVIVSNLNVARHPDSYFVIDWKKPGNLVGDSRVPDAETLKEGYVSYRVPANLDQLDEVIAGAVNEEGGVRGANSLSRWFLWGNVIFIVVLFFVFGFKRWRARAV